MTLMYNDCINVCDNKPVFILCLATSPRAGAFFPGPIWPSGWPKRAVFHPPHPRPRCPAHVGLPRSSPWADMGKPI